MLPSPGEHGWAGLLQVPPAGYFVSTQGSPDALWLHLTSQLTRSFSLSPKEVVGLLPSEAVCGSPFSLAAF